MSHKPRSMQPRLPQPLRRQSAGGFSLIELLVAVVIGMALVLAVTGMLVRNETGRRSLTASNDTSQNTAFVAYTLDRSLRSAGSGFSQAWRTAYGCRLLAARGGVQVLPAAAAFPAPFNTVPTAVRLAPLVVHAGAGTGNTDVLAVLTGSSGLGESPLPVLPSSVDTTQMRVPSTVGLLGGDLLLLMQDTTNCMVQQVQTGFTGGADQTISLGGNYATTAVDSVNLTSFGSTTAALVAPLGNEATNQPAMQLLGVGANATLVSYDLLRLGGTTTVTPLADGVADMRAVYGIDTNNDGFVDSWVSPATAPWRAADLLDGSVAGRDNLARIMAVRVGLIVRSSLRERQAVSASTTTLFADLDPALRYTRTLTSDEQTQRFSTVDFTVPLRNQMLAPRL
jgi:type IV pilus assembly protein PilW